MKLYVFFILLTISFLIAYSKPYNIINIDSNESDIDYFNKENTNGIFVGKIIFIQAEEENDDSSFSYLFLGILDKSNDTIVFIINSYNTKNYNFSKLNIGNIIKIKYYTEIIKDDGIEVNRFYYAKELEYLEENNK